MFVDLLVPKHHRRCPAFATYLVTLSRTNLSWAKPRNFTLPLSPIREQDKGTYRIRARYVTLLRLNAQSVPMYGAFYGCGFPALPVINWTLITHLKILNIYSLLFDLMA